MYYNVWQGLKKFHMTHFLWLVLNSQWLEHKSTFGPCTLIFHEYSWEVFTEGMSQ